MAARADCRARYTRLLMELLQAGGEPPAFFQSAIRSQRNFINFDSRGGQGKFCFASFNIKENFRDMIYHNLVDKHIFVPKHFLISKPFFIFVIQKWSKLTHIYFVSEENCDNFS